MATKKTKERADAIEIDPRFQPIVDVFGVHRDVTGGKMMSSYGRR